MLFERDKEAGMPTTMEERAAELVMELRLDNSMTKVVDQLEPDMCDLPWLACYQAMEQRILYSNYVAAYRLAQAANRQFGVLGNNIGQTRALAEAMLARYHLGQYGAALSEITAFSQPEHPCSIAALALAACVNFIGIGSLSDAIHAANQGLQVLESEANRQRRIAWRIVLQRNLAIAYHYSGELVDARYAVEDAVMLAETYNVNHYLYDWTLYEQGLLEQRAGCLELALDIFRRIRKRLKQSREQIWRWTVAAEGHTLRDLNRLEESENCYRRSGWGEGDDGPLMLWLLQGRCSEAHCAAEARLAAAYASETSFEVTNLRLFLKLLELESRVTPALCASLQALAEHYATLGFWYHWASALFHLAAAEYMLGRDSSADLLLAQALGFGATHHYLNFAWWYPARMRMLLHRAIQMGIEVEYSTMLLPERELDVGIPSSYMVRQSGTSSIAVTLRCLGSFEVWLDGQLLPRERWQGYSAGVVRMQRLLLYLARCRTPQSVDAIARYVWPDIRDTIDVAHNVHLTLAGLRRVLEPQLAQGCTSRFVLTTPQGYQLQPMLDITIDLDLFLMHMRDARNAASTDDRVQARNCFLQAEQCYTGDFVLAKADPGESEEYRRAAMDAVRWLATDDLQHRDLDSCIMRARWLLKEDAWDVEAYELLVAAYLDRRDRRAAGRYCARFIRLYGELSPKMKQLVREHRLAVPS